MKELKITDEVNKAGELLVNNQGLSTEYAFNIISAAVLLITGLIFARIVSTALDRVLSRRGIDVTVSCFLAAVVRYAIVAFTVIAVLGRLGVQTESAIAVMGAAVKFRGRCAAGDVAPPAYMRVWMLGAWPARLTG